MVRLLGEVLFQDLGSLELIGIGLVGGQRRGVQGQGIEDRCCAVVWILTGELLHSAFVAAGPTKVDLPELLGASCLSLYRCASRSRDNMCERKVGGNLQT